MSDRFYTIMIVPGSRAKLLRLKVRRSIVMGLAGLAALAVLATALLPVFFYVAARKSADLVALQREMGELRETAKEITTLRDQVAYFENKATKFAMMAGVESLPSTQGLGGLRQDEQDGAQAAAAVENEIDILKERSGVLRQSYEQLEQVYNDQSLLLAATPSIAPVKGMISYGYAWRRDPFTGQRAFHKGLDIVAPRGTRVLAPADGVVTKAGRDPGYGNVIYISHGNGVSTRYAHLDGFAVNAGQEVSRGDVLGYLGNTGRSLGAHLHYEVLVNTAKIDPIQYMLDDTVTY